MSQVRLGVSGAAGRMGQTVIETAETRDDVTVVFGLDPSADADVSVPVYAPDDAGQAIEDHNPDAMVDFSIPAATIDLADVCVANDIPLVIGTTGFDDAETDSIRSASDAIPVLKATNFSRGIQALLRALEPAIAALPEYDIELTETHHNAKRDAPSGTAHTILETIREQRALEPVYGREGIQPRADDEIGVLVSRLGDVRGEHTVRLGGNDEIVTLAHRAEDRAVFAAGALDAAAWLSAQNPGWYTFGAVIDSA